MAVAAEIRRENSIPRLCDRYTQGEILQPGLLAKIVHEMDKQGKESARAFIEQVQAGFWEQWGLFRCGLTDEGHPVFDHVVDLLPVRDQFADFIGVKPGDLLVDLMGGPASMARHLRRFSPAGYVNIDGNPAVAERARKVLARSNIENYLVAVYDLSQGLPDILSDVISETRPTNIRYISNWGITYLDAERMGDLIDQCLDPQTNKDINATVCVNMITDGSFNPEVLSENFRREIVPYNLIRPWRIPRLKRARVAQPMIVEFGKTLKDVVPIWYPEEVQELLAGRGFTVTRVDRTLLWGQSTAMEIQRAAVA